MQNLVHDLWCRKDHNITTSQYLFKELVHEGDSVGLALCELVEVFIVAVQRLNDYETRYDMKVLTYLEQFCPQYIEEEGKTLGVIGAPITDKTRQSYDVLRSYLMNQQTQRTKRQS